MNFSINAINRKPQTKDTIDRSKLGRLIIELNSYARKFGVHIEYQVDFEDFRNVVDALPDKGMPTPIFDVGYSDIGPNNGFWIKGTDNANQVVHVQAIRFDDLTGTNLAFHWQEHPELYRTRGLGIDVGKSNFVTAPASHEITGPVCYHGELWLDKCFRGLGGLHLASRLANFAMLIALARFNPNFIYCLMVPKVVRSGRSVRFGYLHMHPHGIRWHIPERVEPYDEYLVWITAQELAGIMDSPQGVC